MEERTQAAIGERTKDAIEVESLQRWVSAIDEHFLHKTTQYMGIYSEAENKAFSELVGHDRVTSDQIIAYSYEATANERLYEQGETLPFKGAHSIDDIQNRIGDIGVNLEFANCFKTKLAVALDSETMIVYDSEVISWGVVCEACSTSTDPDIIEDLELHRDTGYGCGHEDDAYTFKFGAQMTQRTDAETFFRGADSW